MNKFSELLTMSVICSLMLLGCTASGPEAETGQPTNLRPSAPTAEETTLSPTTTPAETTVPTSTASEDVPQTLSPDSVSLLMETMTEREKVGQLFMIRPESLNEDGSTVTELSDEMKLTLEKYPAGGVILFYNNIQTKEQTQSLLNSFRQYSPIPPFLAVDEEGGTVSRLAAHDELGLPRYKSAAALEENPEKALEMGTTIGAYLRDFGFNMNMAPVADVNTNPHNPVIGSRAFSSDPIIAAQMCAQAAEGLRSQGIIPVFKHFPGHGDTRQDSHKELAFAHKSAEEMAQCEWIPFEEAQAWDGIMAAHVACPEITKEATPASLSHHMLTGILKEKLGFTGLIMTDSLEMDAICENYGSEEAAVMALQAGSQIVLMPKNYVNCFDAVMTAVEKGEISQELLNDAVEKILRTKEHWGLLETAG